MSSRWLELLRALNDARIDYVLVGGLSAVLRGAPISTLDVDIVHRREPGNLERLLAVLDQLDAVYRAQPERRLRPTAAHLASAGHQNLTTRLGALDLLGTVGENLDYDALLESCSEIEIDAGLTVRVLRLDAYIALKEQLGSEKDRAVLPTLRQAWKEKGNRG